MKTQMMHRQIVCFGELMMRLAPEEYLRFGQGTRFEMTFGGAEANVAIACAQLGENTAFVTKLPDNPIAQSAVNAVRAFGVNVDGIVRGGERMGIYFCEKGAAMRPTSVIYDRSHSAIAEAAREDFAWDTIFEDAVWYHFTGITPALSQTCEEISLDACKAAKALGLMVSCDLNYRSSLWTKAAARTVMEQLAPMMDVMITNIEQVDDVFGIHPQHRVTNGDAINLDAYYDVSVQLHQRFGCRYIAYTTRKSISASDNETGALLYDAETDRFAIAPQYQIHIVDRVGGGDAFAAAMIVCMMRGCDLQTTVRYAAAAAAWKHTISGDYNRMTMEELETLAAGNTSGRVQR